LRNGYEADESNNNNRNLKAQNQWPNTAPKKDIKEEEEERPSSLSLSLTLSLSLSLSL